MLPFKAPQPVRVPPANFVFTITTSSVCDDVSPLLSFMFLVYYIICVFLFSVFSTRTDWPCAPPSFSLYFSLFFFFSFFLFFFLFSFFFSFSGIGAFAQALLLGAFIAFYSGVRILYSPHPWSGRVTT